MDSPIPEAEDPRNRHPFNRNIDTAALDQLIRRVGPERIPPVMVTITNNSSGGQPVSLEDLRELRAICNNHGLLFFLIAYRFTKNAWLIKIRSPGQQERRLKDIVRDIFDLANVRRSCRDTDRSSDRSRW